MKNLLAVLALLFTSSALAHHGWSEYDAQRPLELKGTIEASGYDNPHGTVRIKAADKTWLVVLAPPARMESRGLAREALTKGAEVTVVGYPHRKTTDELRAERITIGAKTTELR